MDPSLYKAVQEGNLNALREKKELISTTQLTPNKNTILHVAAQFNNSPEFALEILKTNGSLLFEVNSDGETALHVAARYGTETENVGTEMMKFADELDGELEAGGETLKKLLTWKNRNGDTALHEATRNNQKGMVRSLLKKDPEIANIANNALETPLFLAVGDFSSNENRDECVKHIMTYCTSPAYTGPEGKTALHAVASYNWTEIAEELLKKHPIIITEVDDFGWSALHYAALRRSNKVAEELLKADKSIAYIVAEKDDNKTALHIATCQGNVKIMEEILAYCPDCWEMVTGDGQNILHLSVEFEQREAFKFIMKKSWVGNLINQKDAEGNTPLHVYAATPSFHGRDLVNHPQTEKNSVNNKNMTPLDVIMDSNVYSIRRDALLVELKAKGAKLDAWNSAIRRNSLLSQKKRGVGIVNRRIAEIHMVVATLITTVAFGAAFTIPGGYGNDGRPISSRKTAFKIFILADSLAMLCSVSAVILHFFAATETDNLKLMRIYRLASWLVTVALGAMTGAFVFGLLTVSEPSRGLVYMEVVLCASWVPVHLFWMKRITGKFLVYYT